MFLNPGAKAVPLGAGPEDAMGLQLIWPTVSDVQSSLEVKLAPPPPGLLAGPNISLGPSASAHELP